ncbi:MAG: ACT domain-containing protein [Ignavibacteriae bacterium]|nr:ACT domain-containing protein [Ignavibacteriota bacterium]
MLYSNIDRPGMLASVSTILAKDNINIADLSLGRYSIGKRALTVVSVDNPVSESILREIASIQGVSSVKVAVL